MTPTESLLKELETLESKATPGPWKWEKSLMEDHRESHEDCPIHFQGLSSFTRERSEVISTCVYDTHNLKAEDAAFISASRSSLPALLQIIRVQREALHEIVDVPLPVDGTIESMVSTIRQALSRCDEIAKGVGK